MTQEIKASTDQVLQRFGEEERFKVYQTRELYNELQNLVGVGGVEGHVLQEFTLEDRERFQKALDLAVTLHIDQKDRPNAPHLNAEGQPVKTPYLNHVMGVARRVIQEYGVSTPDVIIAAVLHDSVEDQPEKIQALSSSHKDAPTIIKEIFGERVAQIVNALSNPELPKDTPTDTKNRIYLEHVREAIRDPDVAFVKLADFSDNALNLHEIGGDGDIKRLKLSKKYEPVVQLFIDRLQESDIRMPDEKKKSLLHKLTEAHKSIKNFIALYQEDTHS